MVEQYDLLVLGAGPGGYVAAIHGAQLGRRVAVVEAGAVGGACLNRGCIPTKALLHTGELLRTLRDSAALGVAAQGVTLDHTAMHAHKEEVITRLRTGVEELLGANGVDLIRGHGVVEAPSRVRVGESLYQADHILLATGAEPERPPIPGLTLPGVVTSDELLSLDGPPPARLCILGGGVIGVEMATVFEALGTQVTVVEARERILPILDRELAQSLTMSLRQRGVAIYTSARLDEIEEGAEGLLCRLTTKDGPQELSADQLLLATGRRAVTRGLLAPGLDLQLDRGRIPVDEQFRTSIPGVYAVGDVTLGSSQLAHQASAQGVNAVSMMFGHRPPYNLQVIPSCIYTQPEIATVGLDPQGAKDRGIPVTTGKYLMAGNGKTMIARGERGFVRLLFHQETQVLLGAQLCCQRATDLIGGLATGVAQGLTRQQLGETVFPHPTYSEGIGEAVELAGGGSIHTMPQRKRK